MNQEKFQKRVMIRTNVELEVATYKVVNGEPIYNFGHSILDVVDHKLHSGTQVFQVAGHYGDIVDVQEKLWSDLLEHVEVDCVRNMGGNVCDDRYQTMCNPVAVIRMFELCEEPNEGRMNLLEEHKFKIKLGGGQPNNLECVMYSDSTNNADWNDHIFFANSVEQIKSELEMYLISLRKEPSGVMAKINSQEYSII